MASRTLIDIAIQLGSKLGANTSKFLGTRSNVSFLGSGPKDGMLFQKEINPESFAALGTEKVLPIIESSLAYATGGKLNDIQLNKLIKNLKTMDETINPTNVLEMGSVSKGLSDLDELNFTRDAVVAKRAIDNSPLEPGTGSSEFGRESYKNMDEFLKSRGDGGIDSLRAKSGIGERQLTEAASDVKSIDDAAAGVNAADAADASPLLRIDDVNLKKLAADSEADGSSLMKKLDEIVKQKKAEATNVGSPFADYRKNVLQEGGDEVTGIMATVEKGDLPAKTGAAREFLVNTLKVGDDYPSTTLSDVMSAEDMKYVFEGGGGAMGDPLVLVQKYFGPRIAEMVPKGGSSEEIAIFTKRVMDNVEDAKGLKPDEPEFDAMTARFIDEFTPPGGGQPFAKGGRARVGFAGGGQDAGAGSNFGSENFGGDGESNRENYRTKQYTTPKPIGDGVGTNDGGGITSVVTTKNPGFFDYLTNPITSLQKYAGVYNKPEDEEEEDKVSSNLDKVNTISQKGSLYNNAGVAIDARTQANLAKAKELGFKKGGLAKILEL